MAKNKPNTGGIDGKRLTSVVERAETLIADKKAIGEDLKELFAEAKGAGFDVPTIKQVIKKRAEDPAKRKEASDLFDLYWRGVGMTPIEEFIADAAEQ